MLTHLQSGMTTVEGRRVPVSDVAHELPVAHHEEHESTGIDNRKLGMWVFLSSEFLFFGALITNYLLYSNRAGFDGIYPAEIYDIPFTSVSSFVLLMSSLTMVLAHNALSRGDQNGTRTWLFATAALGAVFLGGQVFEFTEFIVEYDMTLASNPAASAFYVLTGFHGTHVAIGVIMLLYLRQAIARHAPRDEQSLHAAIVDGAVMRVRPKAMTVATILVGLLPLFWALGEGAGTGSEVMQRIAAPMLGGMISAPLLSMLVLPAAYLLLGRRQLRDAGSGQ